MRRNVLASLAAICLVAACAAQTEWARLAPFTAARVSDKSVVIRLDETEYDLVSINDVSTADLLEYCRKAYKNWWEKRFTEDLVEVLAGVGHPMAPDKTVKLVVREIPGGRSVTMARAPMTTKNRVAAYLFRQKLVDAHPEMPR